SYTATVIIEVGVLRTYTTRYRCKGPSAGAILSTKRAACAATAGHTVGVLHVAWTL
ncbi:hypothetical protein M9458_050179, partial [Cirrhinus mrigala]